MAVTFYNVRKKAKVEIDDAKIQKIVYEKDGNKRYAFKAVDDDGTKLTLFVSKDNWEEFEGEEIKP